ncbi:hypothetical protein FNV43_RR16749 [Rhamnella rubrinervis]|uniref:Uncharacterized protein n=1 Tax=Rhamnella rubrinervis TaxID=2594499 RepID=A0A8K0GZC7_9ROSA|nr:hypothetical protein FNV43_RR16749 [Rhamnella rubrinervis]
MVDFPWMTVMELGLVVDFVDIVVAEMAGVVKVAPLDMVKEGPPHDPMDRVEEKNILTIMLSSPTCEDDRLLNDSRGRSSGY